jgi:hypothetical protein
MKTQVNGQTNLTTEVQNGLQSTHLYGRKRRGGGGGGGGGRRRRRLL